MVFSLTGGVSFCSGVGRARGSYGEPKVTPPSLVYTPSDLTSIDPNVLSLCPPSRGGRERSPFRIHQLPWLARSGPEKERARKRARDRAYSAQNYPTPANQTNNNPSVNQRSPEGFIRVVRIVRAALSRLSYPPVRPSQPCLASACGRAGGAYPYHRKYPYGEKR